MVERRSRRLPDLAWWEVAGTGAPARRASLPEGSPRLSELDGLNAHTLGTTHKRKRGTHPTPPLVDVDRALYSAESHR